MSSTAYEFHLSSYFFEETRNPGLFKYTVLGGRGLHGQKAHLPPGRSPIERRKAEKHNSQGSTQAPPPRPGGGFPKQDGVLHIRGGVRLTTAGTGPFRDTEERADTSQGPSRTSARRACPDCEGGDRWHTQNKGQRLAQTHPREGTAPAASPPRQRHHPGATTRPLPRKVGSKKETPGPVGCGRQPHWWE